MSCRVYGINSPELGNPDGSGKTALAYARHLCPPGTMVTVISRGWDAYSGRFDGTIILPDGTDFAAHMLESGNAVPFVPK